MSETIEITRYPNRRLYDRSQKKYVTVGDIEARIMDGQNVRILDNKSGEDLTRMILTQILLERHPERMKMFPVSFLHEILRADKSSLDWFTVYLSQAQSLFEGFSRPSAMPLVPGLDFWQAFLPGSKSRQASGGSKTQSGSEESTGGKADEGAEKSEGRESQERRAGDKQELAVRLVELERRLQELERERNDDTDTTPE